MSLFSGVKRQLRSVIEWQNPDDDDLFWQWSANGDEIKNASKLIVAPGQGCIFVYEGKVQSVLSEPCLIALKTANIPFWTTIKKVMQFFESEHKAAIYYFKTSKVLDQKWGTTAPIRYGDPVYRFPVALKCYGNYSYCIEDARSLFATVVGQRQNYSISDLREIMTDRIVHPLSDFLAENTYSYAEIDANREEIAAGMLEKLQQDFKQLGFMLTDFRIEGTDFDQQTKQRIARIADVSAETQAAQSAGLDYAQLQKLEAMREAARNESGAAGAGMSLGVGVGFGREMANSATDKSRENAKEEADVMGKLLQLKQIYEAGLITEDEYKARKNIVLDDL